MSLGASIRDVDWVDYANLPNPTLYENAKEYVDLNYLELVDNTEATEEEDGEKEK